MRPPTLLGETKMAEEVKKPDEGGEAGEEKTTAETSADEGSEVAEKPVESSFEKFEPEVRKSPEDYIRERRSSRDRSDGTPSGDEESPLSEEAQKYLDRMVEERVRKAVEPFAKTVDDYSVEGQIRNTLPKFSGGEKYVPVVKKYMEKIPGLTAEDAFHIAQGRFGNTREEAVQEERKRQAQATRARSSGSSPRPASRGGNADITATEIAAMTPEQFAQFNEGLKGGKQLKTE